MNMHSNTIVSASVVRISVISLTKVGTEWTAKYLKTHYNSCGSLLTIWENYDTRMIMQFANGVQACFKMHNIKTMNRLGQFYMAIVYINIPQDT